MKKTTKVEQQFDLQWSFQPNFTIAFLRYVIVDNGVTKYAKQLQV